MGVRGLKTFFERENQTRPINIGVEVKKWKRLNPGKIPIIVIDFLSLTRIGTEDKAAICGARHQISLNMWKQLLNALKATGSSLVFFSDLNVQEGKVEEWLARRNEDFNIYTNLYDFIDEELTLDEILAKKIEIKSLTSTFYGMAIIAQNYGAFHYSTRHECDVEIAQYAKQQKALAVLTNDTDFLIFDGDWRFWSSQDIHITRSNQLKTVEFDRNGIANVCNLSRQQLPLLATLLANDFTRIHYNQLVKFYYSMGPIKFRIKNVARYVRKFGKTNLTDDDIRKITLQVFGSTNDELRQLFRMSIDSYNTDFAPIQIDDPIEKKLLHTKMYRPYMANNGSIHGITLPFYDMRGSEMGTNFPILLIDWIRRKKGILKKNSDNTFRFLILAKKHINEQFIAHTETPLYPEFDLPTLEELYLNVGCNDPKIIQIKWKLFQFIMSFSNEVIASIQNLPKDYLLIATILFTLVKNGLIGTEEADGILYTEKIVYDNTKINVEYPVVLKSKYVRAAHLYNIAFSHVRQNFAIAGLLSIVQEYLQFDGVYYQNLMEKVVTMAEVERAILFSSVKQYRIYAQH